jgi:hypothetical protein
MGLDVLVQPSRLDSLRMTNERSSQLVELLTLHYTIRLDKQSSRPDGALLKLLQTVQPLYFFNLNIYLLL